MSITDPHETLMLVKNIHFQFLCFSAQFFGRDWIDLALYTILTSVLIKIFSFFFHCRSESLFAVGHCSKAGDAE